MADVHPKGMKNVNSEKGCNFEVYNFKPRLIDIGHNGTSPLHLQVAGEDRSWSSPWNTFSSSSCQQGQKFYLIFVHAKVKQAVSRQRWMDRYVLNLSFRTCSACCHFRVEGGDVDSFQKREGEGGRGKICQDLQHVTSALQCRIFLTFFFPQRRLVYSAASKQLGAFFSQRNGGFHTGETEGGNFLSDLSLLQKLPLTLTMS